MDAIAGFAKHVAGTHFSELPESAISATETLVLDTIGVGLCGSSGPLAQELANTQELSGAGSDAHVWSIGKRLPASAAAMCNAYQVHNSEFDCVHEEAVAHVLSAVVPAAMAYAERTGNVNGQRLIEAVALGVDVACNLGVAAKTGLRFFRPATVGAFAATAGVGKLMGFDAERMTHAFSIVYGQLCGTMQAHEEGSMLLAMQMGFNARNAVVACDLAAAGFTGPRNVLEGNYGYFGLFESEGDIQSTLATLGRNWRIEEVAHKPFPSGRATHGILDGCMVLQRDHDVAADQIESIEASVPPLVHQLVGRRHKSDMDINYARLCAPFVAARGLLRGTVDLSDFQPSAYQDAATAELANCITISIRDDTSANALTPIDLRMRLRDRAEHIHRVEHVYGSPRNPMPRESQLLKFRANAAGALRPISDGQADQLIDRLSNLRVEQDVAQLVPLMIGCDN